MVKIERYDKMLFPDSDVGLSRNILKSRFEHGELLIPDKFEVPTST